MSLATARRRGFWAGWEAREKYPADARPRTYAEVTRLLAEDGHANARPRTRTETADKERLMN